MEISKALDYLRAQHNAVLGTFRADGSPVLTPVTIGVEDDRAVVSTRETAYKVKNLRRDPRVVLCAFPDRFYGQWINAVGEAEIVSLPDAMDSLVAYYRNISGEHPDWDDYRAAMVRDRRCLLRIRLTSAGPDRQG